MAKTSIKTARPFATNNLVRDHEIYAKFMERRDNELKNDGLMVEPPIRLFYKKGIPYKDLLGNGTATDTNTIYRAICKWHCAVIAYEIWCDLVEEHGSIYDSAIPYKQTVSIPDGVYINFFKEKFEKTIQDAGCDYNKRNSHSHVKKDSFDACRYLVMYWTYLDIIKDERVQRYFPDKQTRGVATQIFGYKEGQNPFEMNATYWHHDNDTEEQPVEEEKKYNLNLDTPIEDLDFSTRSYNCLWRAGHRTLGDVLKLKYEDLMKIRNLGLHHTKEILEKLEEIKKQSEESVIDIAEEAAKKVEEEEKLVAHDHSYVIPDEDVKVLAGLGKRLEKIDLEMGDIRANAAAKSACVMLDRRIDELKKNTEEKLDEIMSKYEKLDGKQAKGYRELYEIIQKAVIENRNRPSEPIIMPHKPSDDILSLCNQIVAIMQKSGMEEFCMKGDWVIDIHRKTEMGRATITYR